MSTGGYTPPPKYLTDFSKALASEVKILLAEVGQLRDERRALQHEIAELMSLKSKHGAGGEYAPEWRPKQMQIEEPPPMPELAMMSPPPAIEEPPAPARPGWRIVHKRHELRRPAIKAPPPPPQPVQMAVPEPPRPDLPAWSQWRPNPLLAPTPMAGSPGPSMPGTPAARTGLFGPPTPPPK